MEATGDDQFTVEVVPGEGRTLSVHVIAGGNFVDDFVCAWEPVFVGEDNELAGGIAVVNYFFLINIPGGGGGGGGGGSNTWLFAPPNLPRWLAFSGVVAVSSAINYDSFPPERLRSDEFLPVAYGLARFVLFLSGLGLMALSARASRAPARDATLAMAAMLASLLLLVAFLFPGVFGMD